MGDTELGLNPAVLSWARVHSGFAVEDVARRMRQPITRIEEWESGSRSPTYPQLEKLAEMYKRPIAVFFFPKPPKEQSLEAEFRTLRNEALQWLEPDTRFAIRSARAFQASLYEITGGINPSDNPIHRAMKQYRTSSPRELAQRVRAHLGITVEEQRSWRTTEDAMSKWRDAVERAGIFVQKRSFAQPEISGFCLRDDVFPVIVVNNSTAWARQVFTLFHELAHIVYGVSSFTTREYEGWFRGGPLARIEVRCNQFASQFLLPPISVRPFDSPSPGMVNVISQIADDFHVSREVVLRRLLDDAVIDQPTYRHYAELWNEDYLRPKPPPSANREPRGHWYNTQVSYLGRNFLNLAFREMYAGRLTKSELALHLGVKEKQVDRFEEYVQT